MVKKKDDVKRGRTGRTGPPGPMGTSISNCQFYGVKWDADAMGVVGSVARSLESNAHALKANAEAAQKLINMFAGQNVHIKSMLTLGPSANPGATFEKEE